MKATGIVRKLDELGRIVIPIETRRVLNIKEGDGLEIYTDEKSIVLKKYAPGCVFCNNVDNLIRFNRQQICEDCLAAINKGVK